MVALGVHQPELHDPSIDGDLQLVGRAGLGQKAENLRFIDGGDRGIATRLAGEQNASGFRVELQHLLQKLRAVHAGHAHVRDHYRRAVDLLELLQRLIAAERGVYVVFAAQVQDQAFEHARLVVDTQYARQASGRS